MADKAFMSFTQNGETLAGGHSLLVGGSTMEYRALVSDVAKYIMENYNGSTLAGAAQTPQAAFDNVLAKTNAAKAAVSTFNKNAAFTKAFSSGEYAEVFVTMNSEYYVYYCFSTNGSNCILVKLHESGDNITASASGNTLTLTSSTSNNARVVVKPL